ncbi:hypothetical protein BGZ94_004935 [Podila epigama]|nr:hypothetical protein BGZ94_004935 [Podila epigama]
MDNNINNNNNSPLTIALDLQEHGGVRIDCQTSSLYQKYLETRYYRGQLEQCQHQLWYQQQHLYTELEEVKQRERLYRQQYQEWAQQTANSAPAYSSLVPPSTTISSPSGQHSLQQISAQLEIHSSAPPEACHSTFRTALISAPEQASLFPWSPANTADLVVSNLFPDLSVPPPTPQLVHDTCHQHHSNSDSSNDSSSTYNIAKENKSNTNAINTNVNINANSNANANASENCLVHVPVQVRGGDTFTPTLPNVE